MARRPDLYLGIDGGGTKTAACLLDGGRQEIGRGIGGPCNIATCSDDVLRASVLAAAGEALRTAGLPLDAPLRSVCAGVAGFTAKQRRTAFTARIAEWLPSARWSVEPDYVPAWWGATEGHPGIVAIAGTGAVIYGRNSEGRSCRLDGRGFLLGDRGSAFSIGHHALVAVIRRLDLGCPLEPFDPAILEAIGAADGDDLVEWVYRDFQPARVASLAPVVGRLAEASDAQALRLLESAGLRLRREVGRAMSTLGGSVDELPVYPLGSLWRIGGRLVDAFRQGGAGDAAPSLDLRTPAHDAAHGAALLAARLATGAR